MALSRPFLVCDTPLPHVLRVQLSRPEKKNALTRGTMADLGAIIRAAENDDDVWVFFLTSAVPGVFSSGADITAGSMSDPAVGFDELAQAIYSFSKLFAIAVPGIAVGVGVTILPHADLVWCSDSATFFTPFGRLALVPEMASSVTFPALMGASLATEVLLGGRTLTAQEALRCGLVSDVVPAGTLEAEALQRISRLVELPSAKRSISEFKRLFSAPRIDAIQKAHAIEVAALRARFNAGDPVDAVLRFLTSKTASASPRL
jgi:enoyl-CoA hydratase/carnithine racemase